MLVWKKLIGPNFGFGIDPKTQGKWAVITGATSGIGKAYAEQLAKKGLDIVLVSRSLSKLEEVAKEIKERYGVQVRIVDADLTEGQAVYAKIAKATEELEVFFFFFSSIFYLIRLSILILLTFVIMMSHFYVQNYLFLIFNKDNYAKLKN